MTQKLIMLHRVGCASDLGKVSKMPCATYSLPAQACKVGQKLAQVKGSVCEGCYADGRGNYSYPNVQLALARRLDSIHLSTWIGDMTELIKQKKQDYFRWHDSGDIQSLAHLIKLNSIALLLPHVKFWLPTRETGIVSEFMCKWSHYKAPNLIIRISATMVNGKAPNVYDLPVSFVHTGIAARLKGTKVCPAPKQQGKCGECRNCWNPHVNVSYHKH